MTLPTAMAVDAAQLIAMRARRQSRGPALKLLRRLMPEKIALMIAPLKRNLRTVGLPGVVSTTVPRDVARVRVGVG
jgi:hypothetical protein